MKRDLADFWNLLWEAALGVCAAFFLLNAFAPPQDLPWKPLDLGQPIGRATLAKVGDYEITPQSSPEDAEARTAACIQMLREAGVTVERVPDRDDGGFCVVRGAVRITGGVTPLSPSDVIMRCPMAMRYVIWDRQALQPAAQAVFGVGVTRVDTYGGYACRRINGPDGPGQAPSEHARANALDVAALRLEDGRVVSVAADWDGQGPAGDDGRDLLKRLRDAACRLYATVLTPDYNAAHRDHLHLDGAPRGLCA